ncbi:MAG: methyltransferase domain-containing protein [Rhodospirillales bacterium]|nr:methyltransferase domain-containing protein [Rhodospirillales bacterium]
MPELMRRAVDRWRDDKGLFSRALDLGCGTGLVGEAFRAHVGELHGIDLSAKMLDRARRKGIYDAVHLEDVHDCLNRYAAEGTAFDLVVAAELFIYIGNLEPIFTGIATVLTPGALFAFSVEGCADSPFKLLRTGRYAHGEGYVRALASRHGLSVDVSDEIEIRQQADEFAAGRLYVLSAAP